MPLPAADLLRLDLLRQVPAALRFLSRLPVPRLSFEPENEAPDMAKLGPALPVAGALLGLAGALVLLLAHFVGLSAFLGATLAFAVLAAITGAFHEDGLADTADALGAMNRARRLEIMRDSRIGTFGAVALILGFALRIGALEALAGLELMAAAGALVAAQALTRVAGLWIVHALPPARADGLAYTVGTPGSTGIRDAALAGVVLAALFVLPGFGLIALLAGLALGAAVLAAFSRLASAQFGGQTGDVAGAGAVLAEIAFLLGVLILARPA
ncbi:adenosylcobinamide-GDP ribazoletransferase [Ancylobacter sp. A5.8]|uniref:adenosylcobinamide-GDP ribazoletransferase n=1 Tax=Ancylobacter gelatini TaxID=2919920 RepID=UPI001F4DE25B|nr:adenosylcobinamide-GDP ribazoletransferase [Ancylobacter gelatini]MCJ8142085.1 adenosylcobinamide-GDP ribazoletransferase [Ancylobacter gelatini]